MPGITLPNTGVLLPELNADPGDWDSLLNTCWENYDEHNHAPGNGVAIPTEGIDIDAHLSLNGFGLEDVGKIQFAEIATPTSGASFLFADESDNELYWRTSLGVNLKITSGSGLNISLLGGIAGDYATVGAEVAYDDANKLYTFKQEGSPKPWAKIGCGGVQFYQYDTTENEYVSIQAPAALASPYDITLPLELPASTAFVQMSDAGVLTASNVMLEPVDFQGTVEFNADVTIDANLEVTGTIAESTFDGDVTATEDHSFIVSGDGTYKHGEITRILAISSPYVETDGASSASIGTAGIHLDNGVTARFTIPISSNERLLRVSVVKTAASNALAGMALYVTDLLGVGTETVVVTSSATTGERLTLTITSPVIAPKDTADNHVGYYVNVTAHASGSDIITLLYVVDVP